MNIKYAAIITIGLTVSGCNLEALEGKESPSRDYIERLELLEANYAARGSETPPATPVAPAIALYTPPEPECQAVFRVSSCVDGVQVPYVMP